ncbi:hypothetical protein CIB84_014001, partial [Bambusicola thoracicus]
DPPAMLVSRRLKRLLQLVPGRERLGAYRLLPFFFVLGGAMEWFMINVRIGKETFCEWGRRGRSRNAALAARGRYDVYRRKRSERQYEARMEKSES